MPGNRLEIRLQKLSLISPMILLVLILIHPKWILYRSLLYLCMTLNVTQKKWMMQGGIFLPINWSCCNQFLLRFTHSTNKLNALSMLQIIAPRPFWTSPLCFYTLTLDMFGMRDLVVGCHTGVISQMWANVSYWEAAAVKLHAKVTALVQRKPMKCTSLCACQGMCINNEKFD